MFALRPTTNGTPTQPDTADEATMLRYSRTHR
jgi:hypothetical protein